MNGFTRCVCLIALAAVTTAIGCFGGPKRASTPDWNVEAITDGCMQQCDEDGDGFISSQELKNAPGLKYCWQQLDTDGDKKLSRAEVLQRFQDYDQLGGGYQSLTCFVMLNGRPLGDAQLRLVPEPFLADYIGEAIGEVYDENTGIASVESVGEEGGEFGVRSGMYLVEITSPSVQIPAKYNTETTLGVEAAPFTNPFEEPGGIHFRLRK